MAITMQNFGPDGTRRASVVSYDRASAEDRKVRLEAGGATDVEIVETKPGELAQPKG